MRRQKQVIVVALMATALCADRAVLAAPMEKPSTDGVAGQLVRRLTVNLRRVVSDVKVFQARQDHYPSAVVKIERAEPQVPAVQVPLCMFQFRLPPPTL